MTALIDGDSLFYIIAYNFKDIDKDFQSIDEVESSVDNLVTTILTLVKATTYYGLLSDPKREYFRHYEYKFRPYKGTRPPEPGWLERWKYIIWNRLRNKWKFFYTLLLEADDLVSYYAEKLHEHFLPYVICTPDKDLDQCPGLHFDYKKSMEDGALRFITVDQAHRNLWKQTISGDLNDNIVGIPGKGDAKADKILNDCNDPIEYRHAAEKAYIDHFGPHYGPMIFKETILAIHMMTTKHPAYNTFKSVLSEGRPVEMWDGQLKKRKNVFEG